MTDELTPEQEADISRLLAEARHDEPIPADVAARLDAALGDLAPLTATATPAVPAAPAKVTDLAAARHRRRNAGRLLLAAAAVVVGGVAVGQTVSTGMSDDSGDSSMSADSPESADRDSSKAGGDTGSTDDNGGGVSAPTAESASGEPSDVGSDFSGSPQALLERLNAPLTLTSDSFSIDVQRSLAAQYSERRAAAKQNLDGLTVFAATSATAFDCPDADYGVGAKIPAYYDAEEAVLVLRRPRAGLQRVDLLACGTADQLNSVDLPAR